MKKILFSMLIASSLMVHADDIDSLSFGVAYKF